MESKHTEATPVLRGGLLESFLFCEFDVRMLWNIWTSTSRLSTKGRLKSTNRRAKTCVGVSGRYFWRKSLQHRTRVPFPIKGIQSQSDHSLLHEFIFGTISDDLFYLSTSKTNLLHASLQTQVLDFSNKNLDNVSTFYIENSTCLF